MNLAIICYGEFALEVFELAKRINEVKRSWKDICFVEKDYADAGKVLDEDEFLAGKTDQYECVIAIGEVELRKKIYEKYSEAGFRFTTLIDPQASVSVSAHIGEGCLIFPHVYLAHHARLGCNTILHANAIVENDCVIGNHGFVSSGAFIGAGTDIGSVSFIGPNATLRDKIKIGGHSIIGMGSVVTHSFEEYKVVFGNPARIARDNKELRIGLHGKRKQEED